MVGSKFGAGALPDTSSASSRKLRPLSGSASMALDGMTASTTERVVSTGARRALTSTVSWTAANRQLDVERVVPSDLEDEPVRVEPR